ncbi:MAG: hypothetical protein KIT34_08375 [Cyanobacteria bacterium TGS_CYA1]|nr:hypothetical protein [Cyanobacteria bacterium TGS_CYA1]
MSVVFTVVWVLALALIGANLAPGTDRNQFFWSTFLTYQKADFDWLSLIYSVAYYLGGPILGFAYHATSNKWQFKQIRLWILTGLLSTVCVQSYYFFVLVPYYFASFFEVSSGCTVDCSVCIVSLKEKFMQAALHSLVFYTYVGAIFLAVKPFNSSLKYKSRSFYICALFFLSFVLNEIFNRFAWAESCIHQGFH